MEVLIEEGEYGDIKSGRGIWRYKGGDKGGGSKEVELERTT